MMAEGRIVETGTYHELLSRPQSLFAELHHMQDGADVHGCPTEE
ncbi:hypothetical protein [Streptomyces mangrovisoli]|nr:hypothetical protein [Streptomyces mangrovisoli]